jgi:hypothetical protein
MSLRPGLLTAAIVATAFGICLALYRWGARGNGDLWALTRAVQHGEELASISTVLNSPTIFLRGGLLIQANRMNNGLFPNQGIGVG